MQDAAGSTAAAWTCGANHHGTADQQSRYTMTILTNPARGSIITSLQEISPEFTG